MSATKAEVAEVKAARDEQTALAEARGHRLVWTLGLHARRRGHVYHWDARCQHCGAEMIVGSGWTSCSAVRDARNTTCSGPGTSVLTDIEAAHLDEQITAIVADFRQQSQQ